MVPLTVLEWAREDAKVAREDAKAQAAREARLNDARFDEVKARIELLELVSAQAVATALFERDVARGKVTARALIEEATAEAWRAWERLDAMGRELAMTERLKALLGFPGVEAYLQVAEEDNGLARGVLAKSAAIMYSALCVPLHARAAGAQAGQLPAEVLSAIGENGRIAFAALVAFGGRNVGMYHPLGATVPVVLRVPPVLGISATLQHIRGSAKLPSVEVSVELGVAGGAGPSGEGGG